MTAPTALPQSAPASPDDAAPESGSIAGSVCRRPAPSQPSGGGPHATIARPAATRPSAAPAASATRRSDLADRELRDERGAACGEALCAGDSMVPG